ncbi:hypothetical protein HDU99_008998 [Rhizoclosmatium hyalinum]|nr:hypothetical protein HDU99_008998 [Rhizoclosmatium hyalinum]
MFSDAVPYDRPCGDTWIEDSSEYSNRWLVKLRVLTGVESISSFPAGYEIHTQTRTVTKNWDCYLFGHPSGYRFRSPNEFAPHFLFLMSDRTIRCFCKGCQRCHTSSNRSKTRQSITPRSSPYKPIIIRIPVFQRNTSSPRPQLKIDRQNNGTPERGNLGSVATAAERVQDDRGLTKTHSSIASILTESMEQTSPSIPKFQLAMDTVKKLVDSYEIEESHLGSTQELCISQQQDMDLSQFLVSLFNGRNPKACPFYLVNVWLHRRINSISLSKTIGYVTRFEEVGDVVGMDVLIELEKNWAVFCIDSSRIGAGMTKREFVMYLQDFVDEELAFQCGEDAVRYGAIPEDHSVLRSDAVNPLQLGLTVVEDNPIQLAANIQMIGIK